MTIKNIWEKFSFEETPQKSALDYLSEFKEGLVEQTGGELILQTEAVDAIVDGPQPMPAAVYKLFVVAPKLGHYRRKILTVVEYSEKGRFPVDIANHFSNETKINVIEENFIDTINSILISPIVKGSIENLYQQSKQNQL